jgi:hypothetical protein
MDLTSVKVGRLHAMVIDYRDLFGMRIERMRQYDLIVIGDEHRFLRSVPDEGGGSVHGTRRRMNVFGRSRVGLNYNVGQLHSDASLGN